MKTLQDYDNEIKAAEERLLKKLDEAIATLKEHYISSLKIEATQDKDKFIDKLLTFLSYDIERYLRGESYIYQDKELDAVAKEIHKNDYERWKEKNYDAYQELGKKFEVVYAMSDIKFADDVKHKWCFISDYKEILKLKKESETLREHEARKAQLTPITSKLPPI